MVAARTEAGLVCLVECRVLSLAVVQAPHKVEQVHSYANPVSVAALVSTHAPQGFLRTSTDYEYANLVRSSMDKDVQNVPHVLKAPLPAPSRLRAARSEVEIVDRLWVEVQAPHKVEQAHSYANSVSVAASVSTHAPQACVRAWTDYEHETVVRSSRG